MEIDDYQRQTCLTAHCPVAYLSGQLGTFPLYEALGLAGEVGEVLEIIKKSCRGDNPEITEINRRALELELGDVLWYLAQLAEKLGLDLNMVALANLSKLRTRYGV